MTHQDRGLHSLRMSATSQFFRASVGIAVVHPDGKWLALRRADVSRDAWQLPQGGLKPGEEPETAMWRELKEETALSEQQCDLVEVSEDWLAYELPEPLRTPKVGRGQVQRWFLCRFTGVDADVLPDGKEFTDWKWMSIRQLVDDVAAFRRRVYTRIAAEFADHLR